MQRNTVELEPIYVRISPNGDPSLESSDDESSQQNDVTEPLHLVEEPAPSPEKLRRRKCRRIAFGVLLFFTVFWVTSLLVSGYFLSTSIRQCIHSPHHKITGLTFTTEQLHGLDLFAVAGTIKVHSCPYAKNITIRVEEGAANEKLLQALNTQYTVKDRVLHLFAMGPSFDWNHCQLSHIQVVVPSSSKLSLRAQVVSGEVFVDAKAHFEQVELGTSFGMIKSHHLHVSKSLNVRADVGYVSLHNIQTNITKVDVQTGIARLHSLNGVDTRVEVKAGLAQLRSIESAHSLSMTVDLGGMCASDIGSSKTTTAVVDYGYLRLQPAKDVCYAFLMETRYGQLNVVSHHDDHHSSRETSHVKKSGLVGIAHNHTNIFVSSHYGHVTLVTERPIVWKHAPEH